LLSDQGPYGASVTVLDMENKKVLGESVLFASSAPVAFKTVSLGPVLTAMPLSSSPEPQQPVRINQSDLAARTSAQHDSATGDTVTSRQSSRSLRAGTTVLLGSAATAVGAALAFLRTRSNRKERTA
jgi:hypothetical protein